MPKDKRPLGVGIVSQNFDIKEKKSIPFCIPKICCYSVVLLVRCVHSHSLSEARDFGENKTRENIHLSITHLNCVPHVFRRGSHVNVFNKARPFGVFFFLFNSFSLLCRWFFVSSQVRANTVDQRLIR